MFLSIYVYRRLALTLDLTDDRPVLPRAAIREGPAFRRLTATPENLQDPVRLRHWLGGFLPENGALVPYRVHARQQWERWKVGAERDSTASILWGNTDGEYTGAIDFRQTTEQPPVTLPPRPPAPPRPLHEREIGARLDLATRIAGYAPRTSPDELLRLAGRRSALSGMRGKLSLTRGPGDSWGIAHGDTLNTWIVKHEQRESLPGEAGLEAICQRALQLAGIPAAETEARVFDGQQAVVSRRTDRVTEADGTIGARHQEEWSQAACHPSDDKYDDDLGPGPQWPDAYRLLQTRSADPHADTTQLTRVLASAWMLGNGDLHRRNLGFLHAPAGAEPAITLAPLYDVSSSAGLRYTSRLAVSMDGVDRPDLITPTRWNQHSNACALPADITFAVIDELFGALPDALSTARAQAQTSDENLSQADVDRRVDATIGYVRARERAYLEQQALAKERKLLLTVGETSRMGRQLRAAIETIPGGTLAQTPSPNSTSLALRYIPPEDGQPAVKIGAARSARQAAAVIASAGAAAPQDIPELERTIEKERAMARARSIGNS